MPNNTDTPSKLLCVDHDTVVRVAISVAAVSILLVLLYLVICMTCKKKRRLQEIQLQSVKRHLQSEDPYDQLVEADDEQQQQQQTSNIKLSPASILRQQSLPADLDSL